MLATMWHSTMHIIVGLGLMLDFFRYSFVFGHYTTVQMVVFAVASCALVLQCNLGDCKGYVFIIY